jgi:hypothetical protein
VVAVAAAITAFVVAILLQGQPWRSAVVPAALVGIGTFVLTFAYHAVRAPGQIEAERVRLLAGWRNRYRIRIEPYPEAPEPGIIATGDTGPDLEGAWCRVQSPDGSVVEARQSPTGIGLELPGNRASIEWMYPSSFGTQAQLVPGLYKASLFIGDHAEPAASVEWKISPMAGR